MEEPDHLNPERSSHSNHLHVTEFEFSPKAKYVVLNVGVHFEPEPSGDRGEFVEAKLIAPNGHQYPTWRIGPDETCHHGDSENCSDYWSAEWVVLNGVQPGTYRLEVRPSPEMGELGPTGSHFYTSTYQYYHVQRGSDAVGGDNIYWFSPDGSVRFVENGSYLTFPLMLIRVPGAILVGGGAMWVSIRTLQKMLRGKEKPALD